MAVIMAVLTRYASWLTYILYIKKIGQDQYAPHLEACNVKFHVKNENRFLNLKHKTSFVVSVAQYGTFVA